VQDLAAAELGRKLLRLEVALVDLPARAVLEDPLLPLFARSIHACDRVDHDELRRDTARLGEKELAVARLEVPVEVTREHALESSVLERQIECVALDEGRVRRTLLSEFEHAGALVETGDLAAEVPRQEAGSAGNVERPCRRQLGDGLLQRMYVVVPVGAIEPVEATEAEVPVVVLGSTRVVVLLHGS